MRPFSDRKNTTPILKLSDKQIVCLDKEDFKHQKSKNNPLILQEI